MWQQKHIGPNSRSENEYAYHPIDFADATLLHPTARWSPRLILTTGHDNFEICSTAGRNRFSILPKGQRGSSGVSCLASESDRMANPEHLARLLESVSTWNTWRKVSANGTPDLAGANLTGVKLGKADLNSACLNGATLSRADLSGANLNWAQVKGTKLVESNLSGASLCGTNLFQANLGRADLRQADLSWADLHGANLTSGRMGKARLCGANLDWANLSRADLTGADLTEASLSGTILSGANLSLTDLTEVNLTGAMLSNAKFSNAFLSGTVFGDNDLRTVKGLDTAHHQGPSTIGIDTVYRSQGNIPEGFLRGTGVPEDFITYMRSLVARPVEFYSCFISYSTKDQEFAERLHSDLQSKGVRCWFAPHDLQGGQKLHEQIDDAIRHYDKLLLILSAHSINSEWVRTEIAKARKREKQENRRMLFPLSLVPFKALEDWECFDADTGKDSAREIREYFIPDFSSWKNHDSYREAFNRLISDLKSQGSKPNNTT